MAILGNIIKGVIEIKDGFRGKRDRLEEQKRVFQNLLTRAADTVFGRKYGFKGILNSEHPICAFAATVPFHDYNAIYNRWWRHQLAGDADVTWPGMAAYYALSSGTTGKTSKRIPVTGEMVDAI